MNVVKVIVCRDVSIFTLILTVSSKQTTFIDHLDNKDLPPTNILSLTQTKVLCWFISYDSYVTNTLTNVVNGRNIKFNVYIF